jgi:hypothetical protein
MCNCVSGQLVGYLTIRDHVSTHTHAHTHILLGLWRLLPEHFTARFASCVSFTFTCCTALQWYKDADPNPGSYRGAERPTHFCVKQVLSVNVSLFWREHAQGRIYGDDNELKLPGPTITRVPSKAVGGTMIMSSKCPEILQIVYDRNLIQVFPNLTTVLNILHNITDNE